MLGDLSDVEGGWKWHGGVLAPDGCIYGFPSHADRVLKINCMTGEVKQIGPRFKGRYKWGGGAVGLDGNVYGMPSDTDSVLRIRCATEEVDTIGDGLLPDIKNKWQGGVLAPDGAIYAIPSDADSVLKVVPETATVSLVGQLSDDPDKWQGGFLGADGIIYGIPENADKILRIIPPENDEGMAKVVAAAAASGAASVGKMDGYGKGKGDEKEEKVAATAGTIAASVVPPANAYIQAPENAWMLPELPPLHTGVSSSTLLAVAGVGFIAGILYGLRRR
jgi:LPXTG-motif cell wall-anchored protein